MGSKPSNLRRAFWGSLYCCFWAHDTLRSCTTAVVQRSPSGIRNQEFNKYRRMFAAVSVSSGLTPRCYILVLYRNQGSGLHLRERHRYFRGNLERQRQEARFPRSCEYHALSGRVDASTHTSLKRETPPTVACGVSSSITSDGLAHPTTWMMLLKRDAHTYAPHFSRWSLPLS